MPIPFVDLQAQYRSIKSEIDAAIAAVIEESAFIRGRYVERFEEEFAAAARIPHCVSVANGTDALYIVLRMLGIGPGDEVITSASSWISSSETITQAGAVPVFADIEPDYFNLDPLDVERRITPRTKAIIAVHLLGQPADLPALRGICDRRGLFLIEDCAQAHLAEIAGRPVGSWGEAGTFSFYPGKNLGAYGDAGAIVTKDPGLAAKCRCFARHGADAADKHNHIMEGINSRLDGLQAAILSVKLPYLEDWTRARERHAANYNDRLSALPGVVTPKVRPGARHVYHIYQIEAEQRDALQRHLTGRGISTARHYPVPLPFLKAYSRFGSTESDYPVAAAARGRILSLPLYPELTEAEADVVSEAIQTFQTASARSRG